MAEIRISFRPHEIRLLIGAIDAVGRRCEQQIDGTLDTRDRCAFQFTLDEINAMRTKLESAISVESQPAEGDRR